MLDENTELIYDQDQQLHNTNSSLDINIKVNLENQSHQSTDNKINDTVDDAIIINQTIQIDNEISIQNNIINQNYVHDTNDNNDLDKELEE